MIGTITLYMNTGFNSVDIPADPSVLENASKISYPYNYFERMDVDLTYIDLQAQYVDVRNCDYLKFTVDRSDRGGTVENFYYRCIPQAIAKGVTRLNLQLDGLLTLGGAVNLTYTSGWQERGHIAKADDTLFGNIVSESWVPSQELETVNNYAVKPSLSQEQIGIKPSEGQAGTYYPLTEDLTVVVSNTDVHEMGTKPALTADVIEGIAAGDTEPSMYFPSIPMVQNADATKFRIYDYTDSQNPVREFQLPNTAAFYRGGSTMFSADAENTRKGMSNLYSAGQLSLQASYQIPREYVSKVNISATKAGVITDITGFENDLLMSTHPYEYSIPGYTVKNKKCFATYRTYTIASLASGDMIIKKASELYKSGDTAPSIEIWSDPCSTGKPYCRFKYIKGNPILWQDVVRGLQWQNSQIVIEGASGSVWNSMNTAFSNQQIERNLARSNIEAASQQMSLESQANVLKYQARDKGVGYLKKGVDMILEAPAKVIAPAVAGDWGTAISNTFGYAKEATAAEADYAQFSDKLRQLQLQEGSVSSSKNFNALDAEQALNKNGLELLKNNSVVAPSVSFTPEQNLGMYGYNYFVVYETRKSDTDLISEDMYYQRYGYNGLHRPLTAQCFKERAHYNFVQAFDINLKGYQDLNFGMRVNATAIAQLNSGVRVWRELPNLAAYETN